MRVYIPFPDGSSISFDGESFTVHKKPKDIGAVDRPDYSAPCKAETAWNMRWKDVVSALENAYRREAERKRADRSKQIYRP
ncbi:MAG: hypothetical protein IJR85_10460 [Synergistaceae bacterium]|nr:hypothetical protein [Synergistaceae bacterium]